MKLIKMAATATALLVLLLSNACASHRQVDGMLIGGGTGAIIGQTIGHDTESTIVGAAVGGVVGLMIGSELDRNHHRVHHPLRHHRQPPVVTHIIRERNDRYRHYNRPRHDRRPIYSDHRGYRGHKPYRKVQREVTTIRHGRHGSTRIVETRYSKGYEKKHKKRTKVLKRNRKYDH